MEERTLIIYKVLAQALNIEIKFIKPNDCLFDIYNGDDEFSSRTTWAIEMGLRNHFYFEHNDIYDIPKRMENVTI